MAHFFPYEKENVFHMLFSFIHFWPDVTEWQSQCPLLSTFSKLFTATRLLCILCFSAALCRSILNASFLHFIAFSLAAGGGKHLRLNPITLKTCCNLIPVLLSLSPRLCLLVSIYFTTRLNMCVCVYAVYADWEKNKKPIRYQKPSYRQQKTKTHHNK